ncbi:MAG: hypothetical protein F4Y07_02205 [Gemmatimonadetes bacterium]|nr:hypothetical protein [Gemmatimonadota bacterium]MYB07041.1 hypothetical protein [Gemmatimonadota bacterium]MYE15269.1 hypothetical protein [Gemmatimonadota bacterium]MYG21757.1 hypothetical protein [Gemmatimonadota bacterium]MYJ37453.1 hypothetical protein [Gemmatimonadota bacterium]
MSSRWLIVPRVSEGVQDNLIGTARQVGMVASAVLAVAMGLVFWRQLADFRDPFVPLREDAAILLTTEWGRAWVLGAVGAVLAPILFLAGSSTGSRGTASRASWILATAVAAGMCAFPAFTGHAAGSEGLRWLLIPADILHVLAAGSWIGGLLFVLVADAAARRLSGDGGGVLADVVPRFSSVALVSAGLLAATGTLASFVHIESVGALFTSTYGRLLLAKVTLVLLAMVMGAMNWRRLTPLLLEEDVDAPIRRNAMRELVVAQLVIVVTAVLVRTSMSGG